MHGSEEGPRRQRHARQRRWRVRRDRDRDPGGGLSGAACIWRARESAEQASLNGRGDPAAQRDPASDRGGTNNAPRTRAPPDLCLGQPGHSEQRQCPRHRAQRVEPSGRGLSRHHRHHRRAGLAAVPANGEHHDRRWRAGTAGATELPLAQPMSVQPSRQSWRAPGAATPRAPPGPDSVYRRRRCQPPLDVELTSDDRSLGSVIAHDRAAVAGPSTGGARQRPSGHLFLYRLRPCSRRPSRPLIPSSAAPQPAHQWRAASLPGPDHRHRTGSRSASTTPSGTLGNRMQG